MTEERYIDLLNSTVQANQNTLRVWGGGIYEKDIFYELCDKLGIIVWQDCMFACSTYPMNEEFIKEVENELDYQVPRLQSHACIGLWCGNNENFGALNWFKECNENRVRYLVDYDRLYNGVIGTKIKKLDPQRLYWPSSPCSGPDDFADNWHADNMGDMHYWSVWHERKPFEAYLSIRPRFVSEFGYESFPSMECIKSFAEEKDFSFTSRLMEYHQRSPSGNSIMIENFARYFKFPVGFENMVYLSQVQQAVAIRMAVDWWRSLRPHCMGTIIWQLNDVWPGPSWSSLEYSGKWKLLHYESRKFFSNVYMPLFIKDDILTCNLCNDTKDNLKVELQINYLKFDGSQYKKSQKLNCEIKADTAISLYTEEIPKADRDKYFIYATATAKTTVGKTYTTENTVFPSLYKHSEIKPSNLKWQVSKKDSKTALITLKSENPAFFVSLDAEGIKGNFSNNMFTLPDSTEKTVEFNAEQIINISKLKKSLKVLDLSKSY